MSDKGALDKEVVLHNQLLTNTENSAILDSKGSDSHLFCSILAELSSKCKITLAQNLTQ